MIAQVGRPSRGDSLNGIIGLFDFGQLLSGMDKAGVERTRQGLA
jgi:hypothetical protein